MTWLVIGVWTGVWGLGLRTSTRTGDEGVGSAGEGGWKKRYLMRYLKGMVTYCNRYALILTPAKPTEVSKKHGFFKNHSQTHTYILGVSKEIQVG
jgi:hypothetical protein